MNDFAAGGNLKVRFSTDNVPPGREQLAPASSACPDHRDKVLARVLAGMDEGGVTGRSSQNKSTINRRWQHLDQTYNGPPSLLPALIAPPIPTSLHYIPTPRHMGWVTSAYNHVVSLRFIPTRRRPIRRRLLHPSPQRVTFGRHSIEYRYHYPPQWQPIFVSDAGTLSRLYDTRDHTCTVGNPASLLRMWRAIQRQRGELAG